MSVKGKCHISTLKYIHWERSSWPWWKLAGSSVRKLSLIKDYAVVLTGSTILNRPFVSSLASACRWCRIFSSHALESGLFSICTIRPCRPLTTPVIPRATVRNQNKPWILPWAPWAAVPSVALQQKLSCVCFSQSHESTHPRTISRVVETRATFLPIRSQINPTNICPIIAPAVESKQLRVFPWCWF